MYISVFLVCVQTQNTRKIKMNNVRDYSTKCKNPSPVFDPALSLVKVWKKSSKGKIQHIHPFMNRLFQVASAENFSIHRSNVVVAAKGSRRGYGLHRRQAHTLLIQMIAAYHNLGSGFIPYASITSMAKECGLATQGPKDLARSKVEKRDIYTISRASRAIDDMVEWGVLEKVESLWNPELRRFMPTLLKVNEKFYAMLGVPAQDVQKAKNSYMARQGKHPAFESVAKFKGTLTELEFSRLHRKHIKDERYAYAAGRKSKGQRSRRASYLAGLSKADLYKVAQKNTVKEFEREGIMSNDPGLHQHFEDATNFNFKLLSREAAWFNSLEPDLIH